MRLISVLQYFLQLFRSPNQVVTSGLGTQPQDQSSMADFVRILRAQDEL
ncbi:hypothetical protein EDE08_101620 [Bradyrhizobium sp. R2.2-H]|jgi:hypothetical protein|nr:hypothetical protein EDE10_101621 [Bradyrhizobium sp. Y-H1]TCU80921.1 hypothetical protein EDE08_101620 [Bradyrhizobium sp. R2.2-H]